MCLSCAGNLRRGIYDRLTCDRAVGVVFRVAQNIAFIYREKIYTETFPPHHRLLAAAKQRNIYANHSDHPFCYTYIYVIYVFTIMIVVFLVTSNCNAGWPLCWRNKRETNRKHSMIHTVLHNRWNHTAMTLVSITRKHSVRLIVLCERSEYFFSIPHIAHIRNAI